MLQKLDAKVVDHNSYILRNEQINLNYIGYIIYFLKRDNINGYIQFKQ